MKALFALGMTILLMSGGTCLNAATIRTNVGLAEFAGSTIETFRGPYIHTNAYAFNSGLVFQSLHGLSHNLNITNSYNLGLESGVTGGKDGVTDGYLGGIGSPDELQFTFSAPIRRFGFFGAEARVEASVNDGQFDVDFYTTSNSLISTAHVVTAGVHAWEQFHGFASDVAVGRVVIRNITSFVLDDIQFFEAPRGPVVSIHISEVDVCWDTVSNKTYQLEYKPELSTNVWTPLGLPMLGNGSRACIVDRIRDEPRRVYRIQELP